MRYEAACDIEFLTSTMEMDRLALKKKEKADGSRNDNTTVNFVQSTFFVFPTWRMYGEFPWPIWAVGWLAIFKSIIWLSTNPTVASPLAEILATKYLITMIPFLILGIGVWNLRKWAVWGLIILSVADLLFFIVFRHAWPIIMGDNIMVLAVVLMIFNGPVGNILILLATPVMLKYAGKDLQFALDVSP
jgi:hypothetical protein